MARRPIHSLSVAAHPADSFDQAGGTMAHHIAQGDKVTAVVATTTVATAIVTNSSPWPPQSWPNRRSHDHHSPNKISLNMKKAKCYKCKRVLTYNPEFAVLSRQCSRDSLHPPDHPGQSSWFGRPACQLLKIHFH